LLSQTKSLK